MEMSLSKGLTYLDLNELYTSDKLRGAIKRNNDRTLNIIFTFVVASIN